MNEWMNNYIRVPLKFLCGCFKVGEYAMNLKCSHYSFWILTFLISDRGLFICIKANLFLMLECKIHCWRWCYNSYWKINRCLNNIIQFSNNVARINRTEFASASGFYIFILVRSFVVDDKIIVECPCQRLAPKIYKKKIQDEQQITDVQFDWYSNWEL